MDTEDEGREGDLKRRILIGEPTDLSQDVGRAMMSGEKVEVWVMAGKKGDKSTVYDTDLRRTGQKVRVKKVNQDISAIHD